jgi:YggT family protein
MIEFARVLAIVLAAVRWIVFGLAALTAIVAVVSWAARTRRINPFNPVARFFRTNIDPLMRPVENRVVRAGGQPANAPWWALVFVVVGGLLLIVFLEFVLGQVMQVYAAASSGGRSMFVLLVSWTFAVLQIALLVRVISSWFGMSPYSPWIRWSFALTEWMLAPLRQIIPLLGMIDITPIVAYFLLRLLERVVIGIIT